MTEKIGNEPPDTEVVRKLKELQVKIEKFICEQLGIVVEQGKDYESDFTYYVNVRHDKSNITFHTGNGCPVCAVGRALVWCMENDLRHHENGLPLAVTISPDIKEAFDNLDPDDEDIH